MHGEFNANPLYYFMFRVIVALRFQFLEVLERGIDALMVSSKNIYGVLRSVVPFKLPFHLVSKDEFDI